MYRPNERNVFHRNNRMYRWLLRKFATQWGITNKRPVAEWICIKERTLTSFESYIVNARLYREVKKSN